MRPKKVEIPPGPLASSEEQEESIEPMVSVAGGDDDRLKPGLYLVGKDELGQPLYAPLGYGPPHRRLC